MPKLSESKAQELRERAESSQFEPLEEGTYVGQLADVEVRQGQKGAYWSWEFDLVDSNRKLWVNTSLGEKSAWKLKEMFDAFGYDMGTHTDELVGLYVVLSVTQREITQGQRQGQIGNQVDKVLPYTNDYGTKPSSPDNDEDFGF